MRKKTQNSIPHLFDPKDFVKIVKNLLINIESNQKDDVFLLYALSKWPMIIDRCVCVCVCVCIREREREREEVFVFVFCLHLEEKYV